MNMEMIGLIWFLTALYMWSYYHQAIVAPWPQWTVFPLAWPLHLVGVTALAALTGRIFT